MKGEGGEVGAGGRKNMKGRVWGWGGGGSRV